MTNVADTSSSVWSAIFFIFLGWLLGLVGPIVVDAIKKRHQNTEIRKAILSELSEARFRLANIVYLLESHYGTYDRKLLEWVLPLIEHYRGPNPNAKIVEIIHKQLNTLTDAQLEVIASNQKAKPESGSTVKKYRIPYVESRLEDIGIFDEESQALILDIRHNFDLYNEDVDEARFYFKLTYESGISKENHHRASLSVIDSYLHLATRARIIIERINRLILLSNKKGDCYI